MSRRRREKKERGEGDQQQIMTEMNKTTDEERTTTTKTGVKHTPPVMMMMLTNNTTTTTRTTTTTTMAMTSTQEERGGGEGERGGERRDELLALENLHPVSDLEISWCKIKGSPWWPAHRVTSTSSALYTLHVGTPSGRKAEREGKQLYQFFNGGTVAWLKPEQVLPWKQGVRDGNAPGNTGADLKKVGLTRAVEEVVTLAKSRRTTIPNTSTRTTTTVTAATAAATAAVAGDDGDETKEDTKEDTKEESIYVK